MGAYVGIRSSESKSGLTCGFEPSRAPRHPGELTPASVSSGLAMVPTIGGPNRPKEREETFAHG